MGCYHWGVRVGWSCTYLPVEILEAGGLLPERLLPPPEVPKEDALLDPNFCPYIRSLLSFLQGEHSLQAVVLMNTCDGMRRLFDVVVHYLDLPAFLLDVPRKVDESSIRYFRERLQDLVHWLKEALEVEVGQEALHGAIVRGNKTRALLRRLLEEGVKASLILGLVREGFSLPREAFNDRLKEALSRAESAEGEVKLLMTGSLLEVVPLVELAEGLGAEVTALDLCTGLRFVQEVKREDDPLMALSRAYLRKPPCARMSDGRRRQYLEASVQGVQGVIYYVPKFCDPYLYELPSLRGLCEEKGIPLLVLEGDYTGRVTGGMRTRVEAFLERWM